MSAFNVEQNSQVENDETSHVRRPAGKQEKHYK